MATNFLPVGIINDQLQEIADLAANLSALPTADDEIKRAAEHIFETASSLLSLINGFSSQPLIFTGPGTTEEIIARLEWLLAFSDMELALPPAKPRKLRKTR